MHVFVCMRACVCVCVCTHLCVCVVYMEKVGGGGFVFSFLIIVGFFNAILTDNVVSIICGLQ